MTSVYQRGSCQTMGSSEWVCEQVNPVPPCPWGVLSLCTPYQWDDLQNMTPLFWLLVRMVYYRHELIDVWWKPSISHFTPFNHQKQSPYTGSMLVQLLVKKSQALSGFSHSEKKTSGNLTLCCWTWLIYIVDFAMKDGDFHTVDGRTPASPKGWLKPYESWDKKTKTGAGFRNHPQ